MNADAKSAVPSWPSYLRLVAGGELARRAEVARLRLADCTLCPHECHIDRYRQTTGRCRTGAGVLLASANEHHGEEPPISGTRGSGTIFFAGCSLHCRFCQNYPISQLNNGREVGIRGLADAMLRLQMAGVHNINFVTPTHHVAQLLAALLDAVGRGFCLPLVYNTSGFDSLETLALLDGVVDVYLPDAKYADNERARRCSGIENYVDVNRPAIAEMFRQVGPPEYDEEGIIRRGVIVRHLVLPDNLSGTDEVLRWLAGFRPSIGLSLMSQYFPAHHAPDDPVLSRRIDRALYDRMVELAVELGFEDGFIQP